MKKATDRLLEKHERIVEDIEEIQPLTGKNKHSLRVGKGLHGTMIPNKQLKELRSIKIEEEV